mmetsp:Transcript_32681/g.44888  ORF Transcript_32681/g.44888 Transcript_32681/m.44888 type:complete len:169 (-) Transcript_32681:153-659(-)
MAPKSETKKKAKTNQSKTEIKPLKTKAKARAPTKAVSTPVRPKAGHAKKRKIRTDVTFRRPRTLRPAKQTKVSRRTAVVKKRLDTFRTIRYPLTSEKAMKKIEDDNTLVFIVDILSNKQQIKEAVKRAYNIRAIKVNTLIRPDGKKKAMVKLHKDDDALDLANKIGIV